LRQKNFNSLLTVTQSELSELYTRTIPKSQTNDPVLLKNPQTVYQRLPVNKRDGQLLVKLQPTHGYILFDMIGLNHGNA